MNHPTRQKRCGLCKSLDIETFQDDHQTGLRCRSCGHEVTKTKHVEYETRTWDTTERGEYDEF